MICGRYTDNSREEKEKIKNALSNRNNEMVRELSRQMMKSKKDGIALKNATDMQIPVKRRLLRIPQNQRNQISQKQEKEERV